MPFDERDDNCILQTGEVKEYCGRHSGCRHSHGLYLRTAHLHMLTWSYTHTEFDDPFESSGFSAGVVTALICSSASLIEA
jgi:hypothetical protein